MNLKILITSVLFCSITSTKGQNNSGLIIYDFKYSNENSEVKTIESRLFFNDSVSIGVAYSTNFYTQNKVGINQETKGLGLNFMYGDLKGEIIHRNFKTEKITLRFPKSAALDEYTVQDNWTKIQWKIKDENRRIDRLICKKAIGNYRGRRYTAWFTEEIPLPYGPFKLHGLPGIILEAEDDEKIFSFNLKSVEYPTNLEFDVNEPIEKENKTLYEHVYSQDHIEEILLERLNVKMPKGIRLTKNPNKVDSKRKYRIEKLFEWEK
jgi:GLPGLI family protein